MIRDWDGTTTHKIKTIRDWNGTGTSKIKYVRDWDGTTTHYVYKAEQVVEPNYTQLAKSSGNTATLTTGYIKLTNAADGNVAMRQAIDCSGFSQLVITGYFNKASYQHTGFCVSTDAWSWSKTNFASYIRNGTASTVLGYAVDTGTTESSYTVDVSGQSTVYLTVAGWSYSTSGGSVAAQISQILLT